MTKKRVDADELGTAMEKLAVKLAKELTSGNEPSKPSSDMFGKLTSYLAATRRLNLKAGEEEDEDAPNFSNFKNKINGTGTPP